MDGVAVAGGCCGGVPCCAAGGVAGRCCWAAGGVGVVGVCAGCGGLLSGGLFSLRLGAAGVVGAVPGVGAERCS